MNPGDVVLLPLPQVGGLSPKLRPALVLALLPGPYQDVLVCGISSQLHNIDANWDEVLQATDADYGTSGVHQPSVIRLSYLYAAQASEICGVIGRIEPTRLLRLRQRLADQVKP